MKRNICFTVIIVILVFFSGCRLNSDVGNNTSAPSSDINNNDKENSAIKDYDINLIEEGRVDSIEFALGDNSKTILESLGEPKMSGYFMGGSYLKYDKVTFFINKPLEEIEYGEVVIIGFSKDFELFGIKVGMKFEEIKDKFGVPSYEGAIGGEESELYGDSWALVYEKGDYSLTFVGDIDSDLTRSAYLEYK
jgi:hypothetical protein